jgi:hypothetical protein
MSALGGGSDIVSGAGAAVVSRDDVAHQVCGVAVTAATRQVDVFGLAVLVVGFPRGPLIEVGRIGFAATC